jgi:hypothetical protein
VGVTLDQERALSLLNQALAMAQEEDALPAVWLDRATQVGAAQSKSFTPMLGTALLAKATDDHVSALALKEGAGHTAYSARGLAHGVLVPFANRHGINLRTTGAEPLNNQPFFRYEVVSRHMKVRPSTQGDLDFLVDCLEAVDFLREDEALPALAAFLRVRIADPATVLVEATAEFVMSNPEGGRRGQALGAAALDLVYDDVRTAKINDPSRERPGDVIVMAGSRAVFCSVEVRQKVVSMVEVNQFADRLAKEAIRRAMIFALHPHQADLGGPVLQQKVWTEHGVLIEVLSGAATVLSRCLMASPKPLLDALQLFPSRMLRRLHEMECTPLTMDNWRALISELVP